jgi:hypothetical protein
MNLADKQKEFAAAVRPSFVEIEAWIEAERNKKRSKIFKAGMDGPEFTVNGFCKYLEKMGFEKVGEFARPLVGYQIHPKYRDEDDRPVFVYARPDGVLLMADTFDNVINSARLFYELRLFPETDPIGAYDVLQKQGISLCRFIEVEGQPDHVLSSTTNIIAHPYNLLWNLKSLMELGQFLSPTIHHTGLDSCRISFESDYSYHSKSSGLWPVSDVESDLERDKMKSATVYMVKQEARIRLLQMPLWVQEMVQAKPISQPAPAVSLTSTFEPNSLG